MPDLDAACNELESTGLLIQIPPADYYWGRSAYLRDPEGRLIEPTQYGRIGKNMLIRELKRDEIDQIWQIDRSEFIEAIYYWKDGLLVLQPEHYNMQGWPTGEAEKYSPILLESFDHGGVFYGAFDAGCIIGVAVLESKFIGHPQDQLQLSFLHVSQDYRGLGLGIRLFELAKERARQLGARRLYISATPSEHTVDFYLRLGCVVTLLPDPELFEREPEDIHLECAII